MFARRLDGDAPGMADTSPMNRDTHDVPTPSSRAPVASALQVEGDGQTCRAPLPGHLSNAMTDEKPADGQLQAALETLADPDCREIIDGLTEPQSAQEVAERCDLPRTSAYRKLEALSEAGLLREGTELRADGHHVKTYERAVTGVFVLLEEDGFEFEFVHEPESADRRLAKFWSRISEEL